MTRKNKGHLVKIVKDRLNKDEVIYSSEDVEKAINETLYSIYKAFCDGCSVILEPLGVLKPVVRKSRACRNPRTGKMITISESFSVKFQPSETLRKDLKAMASWRKKQK